MYDSENKCKINKNNLIFGREVKFVSMQDFRFVVF